MTWILAPSLPSCRFVHYGYYRLYIPCCVVSIYSPLCISSQGLTQVEEMLISRVLPIMSLYRLPHGQYAYSGHVINLPQDVACFANSLPRLPSELDIIVIRKEGAANSHRDFHVRRAVVLRALQWLLTSNKYYTTSLFNITIPCYVYYFQLNTQLRTYAALAQARPTMSCILLVNYVIA